MKPFNRFITWTVPKASKLRKQKTSSINIIFTEIGWRLGLHNPRRISSRVRFQNSRIYRKKLFNAKRTGPKILKKIYNRGTVGRLCSTYPCTNLLHVTFQIFCTKLYGKLQFTSKNYSKPHRLTGWWCRCLFSNLTQTFYQIYVLVNLKS